MRVKSIIAPIGAAVVVAVVALALANHSGSSGNRSSVTATGNAAADTISNYAFTPATLTVKAGTRLTWTNHDATAHTATADQGAFDTGTLNSGQSKTIDFNRPGIYTFHCSFHAFMTGTIKVVR